MPGGNIYRGKYRIVETVTRQDVQDLKNKLAIEEENMFYLRHSFLTPVSIFLLKFYLNKIACYVKEQSFGHAKALGKREQFLLKQIQKPKEYKKHITLESRLAHLRYNEAWE